MENNNYIGVGDGTAGKELFTKFLDKYERISKVDSTETRRVKENLWTQFNNATETYIKSSSFEKSLLKAIDEVDVTPNCQILAVPDALRNNRKPQVESTSDDASESGEQGSDPEIQGRIKKFEDLLSKLDCRIRILDETEVDLNSSDEKNSPYLQADKIKKRFSEVYKTLCKLKKIDAHAGRAFKKRIKFYGTGIPQVDKAVEKFYNDRREFPSYLDVLAVVGRASEDENLNLSSAEIDEIGLNAFQELGNTLKMYRQLDDDEILSSYIHDEEDPASRDAELDNALKENQKNYGNRIDEIIQKYTEIQERNRLSKASKTNSSSENDESNVDESDCEYEWKFKSNKSKNVEANTRYRRVLLTKVKSMPPPRRLEHSDDEDIEEEQIAQPLDLDSYPDKCANGPLKESPPPRVGLKRSSESDSEEITSKKISKHSIKSSKL